MSGATVGFMGPENPIKKNPAQKGIHSPLELVLRSGFSAKALYVDWSTSDVSRRTDKVNMAHVAPWFATDRGLFPDTALRPTSFADVPSTAPTATPPRTATSFREDPPGLRRCAGRTTLAC